MIKHVYLSYEKIIPNKYGIKRLNCSQKFRVKVDLDRVFQISRKLPDHKRYIAWCTKNKSNRRKNTQFWIKLRFSKLNLVNMIKSPKQFQTDDLQFTRAMMINIQIFSNWTIQIHIQEIEFSRVGRTYQTSLPFLDLHMHLCRT